MRVSPRVPWRSRPATDIVQAVRRFACTSLHSSLTCLTSSSDATEVFKRNVRREAVVSDRMTSRADGFRYRGCRGCCVVVLVGSASSHNFKAFTCHRKHRKVSALKDFATKLLKSTCLCKRERLRLWMNLTGTTEGRIDKDQHHNAFSSVS